MREERGWELAVVRGTSSGWSGDGGVSEGKGRGCFKRLGREGRRKGGGEAAEEGMGWLVARGGTREMVVEQSSVSGGGGKEG